MKDADIFAAVDRYIESGFAQEDAALTAAIGEMRAAGMPEISVSPVLGKFLYMLAKIVRARRILEVGTLGGYAAIWLGRALPEDGHMLTLEIDPKHVKVARRNLARAMLLGVVEVREGPALESLQQLIASGEEPFDLIFIDADKDPYPEYFELSLRLTRPGTLVVADNVIRQGDVVDPAAPASRVGGVKRLAEALAVHTAVEATILQNVGVKGHDGMALILVK